MTSAVAEAETIEHELIEDGILERRTYQLEMADRALENHTLVCLPTGLGKTTVSLLVTASRLAAGSGRALMLAPTKPLVTQHAGFYREALTIPDEQIITYTGETRPADRAEQWDDARVIMATPQVIENDLIAGRIDLSDVVHLTVDECHRTGGSYPYAFIAERYHETAAEPLLTGMSASPGDDRDEIFAVCERLGISAIEVRTEDDPDVEPYTHDTTIEPIEIELSEDIVAIRDKLVDVIESRLEHLVEMGVSDTTDADCPQRDINAMRAKLQQRVEAGDTDAYQGLSYHAEVMKLRRALKLVETQSVEALQRYFERRQEAAKSSGASKADQRLISDPRVREAIERAREYDELHPKFRQARITLAETLGIKGGSRVLIFTESRDTAEQLTTFLGEHFATRRFVGQTDKESSDGMSQDEQRATIEAFRQGEFEVLVSTSVGEEGLDVPEVDLVLFFEPVPTAIRTIQRKGRTGRQAPGRVAVLIAKDTRDEAFYWMSRRREQSMADDIRGLEQIADDLEIDLLNQDDIRERAEAASRRDADQESLFSYEDTSTEKRSPPPDDTDGAASTSGGADDAEGSTGKEPSTDDPTDDTGTEDDASDDAGNTDDPQQSETPSASDDVATIIVDQRELDAEIGRELSRTAGIDLDLETLDVGDYILSNRVAVERKTVEDFLDSLLGGDRDLFEQVSRLAEAYERPVVILEGERLYERRNIDPTAIRGAVASLVADFGVSVLQTTTVDQTRELLVSIATREQREGSRTASAHGDKRARTKSEQQEYVVSSIAEVGPVTARSLLEEFGSVEAVITATFEELKAVDGVGNVTAERIRSVVGSDYAPE